MCVCVCVCVCVYDIYIWSNVVFSMHKHMKNTFRAF